MGKKTVEFKFDQRSLMAGPVDGTQVELSDGRKVVIPTLDIPGLELRKREEVCKIIQDWFEAGIQIGRDEGITQGWTEIAAPMPCGHPARYTVLGRGCTVCALDKVKEGLRGMIILGPVDSYQHGYNSAILDMYDRIISADPSSVGHTIIGEKRNELQT